MNKIIKYIIFLIFIIVLFISSFSIYVGNYLYNYTLNTNYEHNLLSQMNVDSKKTMKNQQWLDEHSERKSIINKEYLKLNAYYIKGQGHIYIIMVHGYMGSASTLINPMKNFIKRNYHLLVVDLRGHGLSEGNYVGMGWCDRNDILEWIDFIVGMDSSANIILYGESMGASTVLNTAGENPEHVIGVIADCGFTSVWNIFSIQIEEYKKYKYLLLYSTTFIAYLRTGYNLKDASSLKQVEKTNIPILFIHGDSDDIVPLSMMYELYNHTSSYKELLVIKSAGHANSYVVDPNSYYNKINEFINNVYPKT